MYVFFASKILKTLQLIKKIKAWIVTNHNYQNCISCLELVLYLVGTPSGVSKFDFSDNFVSTNSAQIQNFTSWHCRRYKAFIWRMTDFAH